MGGKYRGGKVKGKRVGGEAERGKESDESSACECRVAVPKFLIQQREGFPCGI